MDDASERATVAAAWDAEYLAGRYATEPPLPFVDDIVAAARERGRHHGVYVGCGNGRNYARLVEAGLDLIGLDVSVAAIQQLADRLPDRRARLIVGDVAAVRPGTNLPIVVGIQVFQHGRAAQASAHIQAARALVVPGGLLCVRVNADATDVFHDHRVAEQAADGSYTVQYLDGPKKGLFIHFFSRRSLTDLFADGFTPVMPMRLSVTRRNAPETGQWSQWEGIWSRTQPS
jgi:trans-aconitate methyltransferase